MAEMAVGRGVTVLRWETSLIPRESQDFDSETDHGHSLGFESRLPAWRRRGRSSGPGWFLTGEAEQLALRMHLSCFGQVPCTQLSI